MGVEKSGQGCLFGFEHNPNKGGRGRPPHVWTQETSNKVKLLLALGWANSRIANALGITEPTLRKHYFAELKVRALARDAMNAERAWRLWRAAEGGNIGAEKALGQFIRDNDIMQAGNRARTGEGEGEAAGEKAAAKTQKAERLTPLGKKEATRMLAGDLIGSDPDLAPMAGQLPLKMN